MRIQFILDEFFEIIITQEDVLTNIICQQIFLVIETRKTEREYGIVKSHLFIGLKASSTIKSRI